MTRQADQYFVQQQLGDMNLEESAFAQCPTLLGAQPESPRCEQFDSAQEDIEEDGKAASALDAEINASTGEETDASGRAARSPSAEPRLLKELCHASGSTLVHEGNFGGPRIDASVFPCSGRPPRRMLSLTGTGAVRLRMPWNMATMPPR